MRLVVVLVLLGALLVSGRQHLTSRTCSRGHKCYPYRVLSGSHGYEVREYDETLWVTWEEHEGITSMSDYPFLVEYADEKLSQYFNKMNYGNEKLDVTTPLRIELEILNLRKPRRVSYPVRVERNDNIPAPYHPHFIKKEQGGFVYVKKVSPDLKYKELLHEVAKFMVELTLDKNPFDPEKVSLALFTRPMQSNQDETAEGDAKAKVEAKTKVEAKAKVEAKPKVEPVFNEIWICRRQPKVDSGEWGRDFAYSGNYALGEGLNGGSADPSGDATDSAIGFSGTDKLGSDWSTRSSGFHSGGDRGDGSRSVPGSNKLDGTGLTRPPPQL